MLITIWYLVNQCNYREIAESLGITKGCEHRAISDMMEIMNNFPSQSIKQSIILQAIEPEGEHRKEVNFPDVSGATDGCHIEIKAPSEIQADCIARTLHHSVNLLAVCNGQRKSIYICFSWFSRFSR